MWMVIDSIKTCWDIKVNGDRFYRNLLRYHEDIPGRVYLAKHSAIAMFSDWGTKWMCRNRCRANIERAFKVAEHLKTLDDFPYRSDQPTSSDLLPKTWYLVFGRPFMTTVAKCCQRSATRLGPVEWFYACIRKWRKRIMNAPTTCEETKNSSTLNNVELAVYLLHTSDHRQAPSRWPLSQMRPLSLLLLGSTLYSYRLNFR